MSDFSITKNEIQKGSIAVIEGDILADVINKNRNKVLTKFQEKVNIDGFRKGHVPENILVSHVGELAIYEEAASLALEDSYSSIIKESGIHPIGAPRVSITKIAAGETVSFKIETAVLPKIKLPEYKKIAKEKISEDIEEVKVEEKDVNDALDEMRRSMAHYEKHHQENSENSDHDHGDHNNHSGKDIPENELPELNDEFAKKVGDFATLDILKTKLKESILNEKKVKDKEKKRLKIIEGIIQGSEFELPEVLVESELNKLVLEFKDNLGRMSIGYEDYLKHINKTEEDLKKEWRKEAEKRANIQLILKEIGTIEKIELPAEAIKREVEAILKQYKDADRTNVEIYVTNILLNEEVWRFLEKQN